MIGICVAMFPTEMKSKYQPFPAQVKQKSVPALVRAWPVAVPSGDQPHGANGMIKTTPRT